jgi:adenine-specific DNA-methyltransferase
MTFINKIFNLDALLFLKSLPDGCIDLVVSSPPYNICKEYESRKTLEDYLNNQSLVLSECSRVLKSTGSIMWQVGTYGTNIPLDIRIFPILESLNLIPLNRIIWIRQHGLHARKRFSCRHETILWFAKSKDYIFNLDAIRVPQKYKNKKFHKGERHGQLSCNPLGKNCGDIWVFQNVKHNHEEQTKHPCQFPEDMISRIVLATTNENGVILDPYMGSGTVAVVANKFNRYFTGSEINLGYCEIATRRLSGQPDDKNCFPNLKTLREYLKSNESTQEYKFDLQKTSKVTLESKAKDEEYHLEQIENRLIDEENYFIDGVC